MSSTVPRPKRLKNGPFPISPNSRFRNVGGPIGATVDVNLESDREQEKRLEQEKPTLKVFEIHVWKEHPDEEGIVSRHSSELIDVIIMLSKDFDTIGEQVSKLFGYEELGLIVEIKEIEGPFKSGSVLSCWEPTGQWPWASRTTRRKI